MNGITTYGATILAARLLQRTKAGRVGNESFESKMARQNFSNRVEMIKLALNNFGYDMERAANTIQQHWFRDCHNFTQVLIQEVNSLNGMITGDPTPFTKISIGNLVFIQGDHESLSAAPHPINGEEAPADYDDDDWEGADEDPTPQMPIAQALDDHPHQPILVVPTQEVPDGFGEKPDWLKAIMDDNSPAPPQQQNYDFADDPDDDDEYWDDDDEFDEEDDDWEGE